MVAADPWCIYCCERATTAEHMPPRAMFEPFRPRGMEFPCCEVCNGATKLADQVASCVSHIQVDGAESAPAFLRLLKGIANNAPDLIQEWRIPRAQMKFALKRSGLTKDHGAIRTDGPQMSRYMETFAAKFGFAVHYEKAGQRVGPDGAVAARWYSNKNLIEGSIPFEMLSMFEGPMTLRQGKLEASNRFLFKWMTAGTVTGVFGGFGEAFAVLAIASSDAHRLAEITGAFAAVVRSGDFRRLSA